MYLNSLKKKDFVTIIMKTPLLIAIFTENSEEVSELVSQRYLNVEDDILGTPLQLAMESENVKIVTMLVEAGVDLRVKDIHGNTPLHNAVRINNADILKILLKAGADIKSVNNDGENPLMLLLTEAERLQSYGNFVIDKSLKLLLECTDLTKDNEFKLKANFLQPNHFHSAWKVFLLFFYSTHCNAGFNRLSSKFKYNAVCISLGHNLQILY